MISINRARNILGKEAVGFSDERIEELLKEDQAWAEMLLEINQQKQPAREVKQNGKFKETALLSGINTGRQTNATND